MMEEGWLNSGILMCSFFHHDPTIPAFQHSMPPADFAFEQIGG